MQKDRPSARRWSRFSLRTLLLLVFTIASGFGVWYRRDAWVVTAESVWGNGLIKKAIVRPNSRTFAIHGYDGWFLWDPLSGDDPKALPETKRETALAFSPSGHEIAVGDTDEVRILDAVSLAAIRVLPIRSIGKAGAIRYSPSGRRIAIGPALGYYSEDKAIEVWHANGGRLVELELPKAKRVVEEFHWSDDESLLAARLDQWRACCWRVPSGEQVKYFDHGAETVSLSGNGELMALGSENRVEIWDLQNDRRLAELNLPGRVLTFSGDSSRLIGGGKHVFWAWHAASGQLESKHDLAEMSVDSIDFTPSADRIMVACGSYPGRLHLSTVRVLDGDKYQLLMEISDRGYSDNALRDILMNDDHLIRVRHTGRMYFLDRRRSERGIAWLPEFWIALLSVIGLIASIAGDVVRLRHPATLEAGAVDA